MFEVQREKLQEIENEVRAVLDRHGLEGHERVFALAILAWNESQRGGMSASEFMTSAISRAMQQVHIGGNPVADMFDAARKRRG